jgi:hypothetical protein
MSNVVAGTAADDLFGHSMQAAVETTPVLSAARSVCMTPPGRLGSDPVLPYLGNGRHLGRHVHHVEARGPQPGAAPRERARHRLIVQMPYRLRAREEHGGRTAGATFLPPGGARLAVWEATAPGARRMHADGRSPAQASFQRSGCTDAHAVVGRCACALIIPPSRSSHPPARPTLRLIPPSGSGRSICLACRRTLPSRDPPLCFPSPGHPSPPWGVLALPAPAPRSTGDQTAAQWRQGPLRRFFSCRETPSLPCRQTFGCTW